MRKVYLDQTEATMCLSVFLQDREVICAGTTISAMSVKHKNSEYQRFADDYDIHFIFEDEIPKIDFYTVPQVDIFAIDSDGGYIGSLGYTVDLESDTPICYIDQNQNCFLIAKSGKEFLSNVKRWKELLQPYEDVEFYVSKEEAKETHEFLDRKAIEQSLEERE